MAKWHLGHKKLFPAELESGSKLISSNFVRNFFKIMV